MWGSQSGGAGGSGLVVSSRDLGWWAREPRRSHVLTGRSPDHPPSLSDEPPFGGQKACRAKAWFCIVVLFCFKKSSNLKTETLTPGPALYLRYQKQNLQEVDQGGRENEP